MRIAVGAWAGCVALAVAALALAVLARAALPPEEFATIGLGAALALSWSLLGLAVVRATARHPLGWILLGFGAAFGVKAAGGAYAVAALLSPGGLVGGVVVGWLQAWVDLLAYPAAITLALLVVAGGRFGMLERAVLALAVLGNAAVLVERLVEPGPLVVGLRLRLPAVNPTALSGPVDVLAIGWPMSLVALFAAAARLVWRARAAEGADRRVPGLLGAVAALLALTVSGIAATGELDGRLRTPASVALALLLVVELAVLLPGVLALTVTRHRVFGVERLLDRALIYTGLIAATTALYVGAVGYVGALAGPGATGPAQVVATVVVVIMFHPMRSLLQRGVARLVHGAGGDPRAALHRLRGRIAAPAAAPDVASGIVDVLVEGCALPGACLVVGGQTLGERGSAPVTPLVLPLTWHGEQVGDVVVDTIAVAALPPDRRRFLEEALALAGQLAHEVLQRDRLQASHQALARAHRRLVDAQDAERRRLRHDLHDGVQPALAGLRLKLCAAQRLLATRDARTGAVLAEAAADLELVAAEVRGTLDRMPPALLGDLGLAEAVEATARRLGLAAAVEADEPALRSLPPDLAAAALRIAQEALHNVAAHAGAGACTVTLHRGSGPDGRDRLVLEIEDDGVGPAAGPPHAGGLGLVSMRERAAEWGGECRVTPRPGGGTVVAAQLPVPAAVVSGR